MAAPQDAGAGAPSHLPSGSQHPGGTEASRHPGGTEASREDRFARVTETHTGVVCFIGDRAYKLKKPLSFGFLDFTSREARRAACHREVELNRRLAPDVYLGVADVVDPGGSLCDHLVVMRRLPTSRRLSTLLRDSSAVALPDHLRHLARLLASFHARADRSPTIGEQASPGAILGHWEANASEMARLLGPLFDSGLAERVMILARRYLAGRAPLLRGRVAAGRSCDGHGDLLAEDIFFLDDGPRVLDCIEFDDRLRHGDVLNDIAFLAMDLEHLGRPDLATGFLDDYRRFAGDAWPTSLAHHYVAYRAQVRALVAGLRWEQGDIASAETARELLALCATHLSAGRVRMVVIGGAPGTGKSTLAAGISDDLDAVVLRSDEVRKQLAGIDPSVAAPPGFREGLYGDQVTEVTYRELLRRARTCLSSGESVVLDATFGDPAWRAAARRVASEAFADLDELRCVVPQQEMERRISGRLSAGGDASDATVAVARRLADRCAPWPTATTIDTTGEVEAVREMALTRLEAGEPRAGSLRRPGSGESPAGTGSR